MNSKDQQINDLLRRYGELSVQDLSNILRVSPSSVRRYLSANNSHSFIRRTHGGAILSNALRYDSLPVGFQQADESEIRAIAYHADKMIRPGDIIGLSGGRICTELALNLRFRENITVVTNAVNIACELAGLPGIKIMVCGGMLDPGSYELVGQLVPKALEGIFIHKFFVGTDGITIENGLTNRSESEAVAAREFSLHAGQTILLADHQKFIRSNLSRVVPAENISTIVTTSQVPSSILQEFYELGVEILLASSEKMERFIPAEQ